MKDQRPRTPTKMGIELHDTLVDWSDKTGQSLLFEALHLGTTNISLLDAHKNLEGAKSNGVNESEISDNHSS